MDSSNGSNVRALNLFLYLKKDSWTAACLSTQSIFISQKDSWTATMAQMLEHSAYFELISRHMASANSSNVRALNLYLSHKKTHGQQQWLKC